MIWLVIMAAGLFAGTLGGIIGFGATTILMPILVVAFGPKAAVPIMALAAILGNLARVAVWWPVIAWRAVAAYSTPAIVTAWLGVHTMLSLDAQLLEAVLGVFFIVMIPVRHWFAAGNLRVTLPGLAVAGAVIGFLTGIVANTGPINTPFFLAHGLIKGPFIATEAAASLAMFTSKSTAFWAFGALPWEVFLNGLLVGSSLMLGAWIAKRFIQQMDAKVFGNLIDLLLFVAGAAMIVSAIY
ncbi:MAG: sulfite exporter TauE/SafE family protein [Aestuariivirgaceae bacterium]